MQRLTQNLITAAALALLVGCASTGNENAGEGETPGADATAQAGITTAQPGQEAYSYPYGQAPSGYDTYDASGGGGRAGSASSRQAGAPMGPGGAGQMSADGVVSADRIVYFDFDSAHIRADSRPVIESNARYLTSNRRIMTQLEGHTDERGSREYNIALGERRANAVRQIMIALGVTPQQIRVVSYGEERPAASGYDEQSYALNRRVELLY